MCMIPASIMPLAALFGHPSWAWPSLCAPLRIARDLGWCDHNYPRWGGHTLCHGQLKGPVLGSPASLIGSELPPCPGYGAPTVRFAPVPCGRVFLMYTTLICT